MIAASRRTLITGLVALVAAPAIVKVASLMPVNAALQPGNNLLTLDMITREAVRRFKNSNLFIRSMDAQFAEDRAFYEGEQWDKGFVADGAKIGSQLRVRLPSDFVVSDGLSLSMQEPSIVVICELYRDSNRSWEYDVLLNKWSERVSLSPVPVAPLAVAAVALVAAPEILKTPVTRRFWSK